VDLPDGVGKDTNLHGPSSEGAGLEEMFDADAIHKIIRAYVLHHDNKEVFPLVADGHL
jgi:hypothetical protein